jgi:hypothetical protein
MQSSSILSRAITMSLATSQLPPFKTQLPSPRPIYCKPSIFDIYTWPTYHRWSITDMKRFSQPLWANFMSYHFSLFLNFIPLYISLIYGVFFKKALQEFVVRRWNFIQIGGSWELRIPDQLGNKQQNKGHIQLSLLSLPEAQNNS